MFLNDMKSVTNISILIHSMHKKRKNAKSKEEKLSASINMSIQRISNTTGMNSLQVTSFLLPLNFTVHHNVQVGATNHQNGLGLTNFSEEISHDFSFLLEAETSLFQMINLMASIPQIFDSKLLNHSKLEENEKYSTMKLYDTSQLELQSCEL